MAASKANFKVYKTRPKSLAQYIDCVVKIRDGFETSDEKIDPWFRGQVNAAWPLTPGAFRAPGMESDILEKEDAFRHDFALKAFPFLHEAMYRPRTEWDWYFLMQHYGLPTRLLDWSESAMVALYFATNDRQAQSDGCVWMLNPYGFNKLMGPKKDQVFTNEDKEVSGYLLPRWSPADGMPKLPACIQPPYNSRRLTAQRGMFTIHGRNTKALEQYPALKDCLVKIVIPSEAMEDIRSHLMLTGMTESTVFPDLVGLCKELHQWWSE